MTSPAAARRALIVVLASFLLVAGVAPQATAQPLRTGFADGLFSSPDAGIRATWLDNARKARADIIRLEVSWRAVAPVVEPADPTDPESYNWGALPAAVADARARGLDVLLTVAKAPNWAEGKGRPAGVIRGTWKPSARKFGQFARALALEFKGQVRHYQAWNEPNIYTFLNPQYEGRRLVGAQIYRRLLNAFYRGVHEVQRNAVVLSAGTAPYGEPPGGDRTRPLAFMRDLLCLKDRRELKPTKCKRKAKLDAYAHHPINTSGGPKRSAIHPDDVATPDVKNVVRTLRRAEATRRVRPRGRRQVWLTEFWWESKPPDTCTGVPVRRHKRWIAEALRSFRRQGASVAINFLIRDQEYTADGCGRTTFQTGIFFSDGSRKPAFKAFRRFGRG